MSDTAGWEIEIEAQIGALPLRIELHTSRVPVALVGPNGAGKTTLLRILAGAVRPQSGRIALAGRVLYDSRRGIDVPIESRRLGYVPQGYGLFDHMSALDNVAFGIAAPTRAERRERALQLLERLHVGALAERRPAALSGGEKQRVALARALAVEPAALLLDEPLAALDVAARRGTRAFLTEHLKTSAVPGLVVTHDARDVRALDAEVAVLEGGRILQRGGADELAAAPASAFVAELFEATADLAGDRAANPAADRAADHQA